MTSRAVRRSIYRTAVSARRTLRLHGGGIEYNYPITVAAIFPHGAFADAPSWSPGDGWRPLRLDGTPVWWRDNGDGSYEMMVGNIDAPDDLGDLEDPDGPWSAKVFTVHVPGPAAWPNRWEMLDKSHRIRHVLWDEVDDGDGLTVLTAPLEPYEGHPIGQLPAYFRRHGFYPEADAHLHGLYGGRWYVARDWDWDQHLTFEEFVTAMDRLRRRYGAEIRAYRSRWGGDPTWPQALSSQAISFLGVAADDEDAWAAPV